MKTKKERVLALLTLLLMFVPVFVIAGQVKAETAKIKFVKKVQKNSSVLLSWNPVSEAADYVVTRTDAAPDGTILKKKAVRETTEDTSFEDMQTGSADAGKVFEYTVTARNTSGRTIASGKFYIVKVSTPKFTVCKSDGGTGAVLKWKKTDAASGYRVQWVMGSGFGSSTVRTKYLPANQLSLTITNLEKGQKYSFRIQAKGKGKHKNNGYKTVTCLGGAYTAGFTTPEEPKAKVVLHYNNGKVYRTVTVSEGSNYTLPAMDNPAGCTFMGWGKKKGIFMSQRRPVQLWYEAYQDLSGLKGTTHLYAVLMQRSEEEDLTNEQLSAPDVSGYKKIIFVGDSRTVRMERTLKKAGLDYQNDVVFIGKVGKGLSWLQDTAYDKLIDEIDGTDEKDERPIAVIFNLGINNLVNDPYKVADKYISYMMDIAPELHDSNCRLFYMSVNPVNSVRAMKAIGSDRKEWKIRAFNGKICTGLRGVYTFINSYTMLMRTGYSTDAGAHGEDSGFDDGIHYTPRTYKRIYLRCMEALSKKN